MNHNKMDRTQFLYNIAENLEIERVRLGLSQSEFAKSIDLSLSSYKRLISGETQKMDIYTGYLIYRVLGKRICELGCLSEPVFEVSNRLRELSPSQLNFVKAIVEFEADFRLNTPVTDPPENYITVLCPTGDMHDGMIWDSCNLEKHQFHGVRQAHGDSIKCGIKVNSNHLHPVYQKSDIIMVGVAPIRDGDIGIFVNKKNRRAYLRKFRQGYPCKLEPINEFGEAFEVDSEDKEEMDNWIKFGRVITKLR